VLVKTLWRPVRLAAFPLRRLLARQLEAVLRRNSAGTLPRGPRRGVVPSPGEALNVLVMGDSTVGGKDIPDHTLSLGCQLAAALSARTGRAVRWAVLARGGATPRQISEKYAARVARYEPDVIVVGLGGNCLPQGYSAREWGAGLAEMIDELHSRAGAVPVVLAATPPVRLMKAVPQPLRTYWALRNHLFDAETKRLVRSRPAVVFGPSYVAGRKEYLGPDGCHPSAEGYSVWGKKLADTIVPLLPDS
jgi:lysophospholipase L1-like esterase